MRATQNIPTAQQPSALTHVAGVLLSWRFLRLAALTNLAFMSLMWAVLLFLWLGGSNGRDRAGVVLGPDFPAFYTGGWLLRHGEIADFYNLDRQQAVQQVILPGHALSAYVNPPHYSFVAAPFSTLSYPAAFTIWSLLMVTAFAASIVLLRSLLPSLQSRSGSLLAALALLCAPVYFALSAGQNTGLSLLLHTSILLALLRRRDTLAGLLIALGLFKPQLFVVLLPLLLLDRRWRAIVSFGIGSGLIGLLTLWWFGWDTLLQWVTLLRSPQYQFEEVRQAAKMFSWQPFWLLLIGHNVVSTILGWLCALAIFAGLCYLWWRADHDLPLRYAITLCGIIVIGPHLPVYDLALLILPGLIIVDRLLRAPPERWIGLRVALLTLYAVVIFAAQVNLRFVLVVVPLVTLVGVLTTRLTAADTEAHPLPANAVSTQ